MKISYLLCSHNETDTLRRLLERLINIRYDDDEIVILDDFSDNETTKKLLNDVSKLKNIYIHQNHLNNNYSSHKNIGIEKCRGDFICQFDGDELPSDILILNIRDIINANKTVELIYVPRINAFVGVTQEHCKQWGWKMDDSPTYKLPRINFPDYQGRIFKNDYPRIRWERKLHEKIEGCMKYAFLPADEDLAIYHDKTILQQVETNIKYNQNFSKEDNMGHKIS